MQQEYLLLGTLAVAALTAVALGVAGCWSLSRLSSRLADLEFEVEKKAREFDALRNTSGLGTSTGHTNLVVGDPDDATPPQAPCNEDPGSSPTAIHIVRNVRGSFSDAQISHLEENVIDMQSDYAPSPEPPSHPPTKTTIDTSSLQHLAAPNTAPQPAQESPDREILDVVSEGTEMVDREELRIEAFSPAKQGADFQQVSRELGRRFPLYTAPHIAFDLAGVIFLEQQELDYLETIATFTKTRGLGFSLVNVSRRLYPCLQAKPELMASLS